ncbi:hypothetical protein SAMN02745166_03097 [Prosthecobacter debontii]|uniref:Uncharacterized protein n=1 Tax=Prosthecobacter debontii TaxID=48467 RepID=A0A1T4YEK7_9BACT|nr:hypothetical protein [Prosthecobacter debontii]SKB00216.1 hypothetical protein SAMN02745166_03097 [Prosthecobacter debontii]
MNEAHPPSPDDAYWNTVPLSEAFMAWWRELVSVERVESEPLFGRERPLPPDFPDWVALKQQLQPGDQLWTFDSPKRFWS